MDLDQLFEVDLNQKLSRDPNLLKDVSAIYQLKVGEKTWHVDLGKDRKVSGGAHSSPDLSIEMPVEAFENLIHGKLNITWALATRKIKISGSLSHLARLKELFA